LLAGLLAALRLSGAAYASDSSAPESMTLDAAVAIAVSGNPGLEEMRRRAEAAAAVPSQVGSLQDPRVTLGAANVPVDSWSFDQEPMTQVVLAINQAIPYPGRLKLRREEAELRAEAASESADEATLRLVRDVRTTWWELFYLDRADETISRNSDLLRKLVEVARTKYEVGRGLQQDVLLAQVELSRLEDMAVQVRGMRGSTNARLNALLARPEQSPLMLPHDTSVPLPNAPPESVLQADAESSRSSIAQARLELEAAQSAQALAHKEYLPEFGVGVSYGWRQGHNTDGSSRSDFASVLLNFNVPLFASSKQNQLIAQRRAESAARDRALAETRNRVTSEISDALSRYRQAREELALLDDGILPQTRQAVASMMAGYEVSKVDFLTLIRTQITLYDQELQRWRVLSHAHQALALLLAAVGKETLDE